MLFAVYWFALLGRLSVYHQEREDKMSVCKKQIWAISRGVSKDFNLLYRQHLKKEEENFQDAESQRCSELLAWEYLWIIVIFFDKRMVVTLYYILKWLKWERNETITNDGYQVIPIGENWCHVQKYNIVPKTYFGELRVLSVTAKDTAIFIDNPQNCVYIGHKWAWAIQDHWILTSLS